MNIPRIMIAAAGSGSGKTLLSCALMMLFSQDGTNGEWSSIQLNACKSPANGFGV